MRNLKEKGFTPTPTLMLFRFWKIISKRVVKFAQELSPVNKYRETKKLHKSWCRGFTLIELLIVIAVISILASVILGSLNSARMKARDAQRVSDLHQIRNALMLYYDDHGSYPTVAGWYVHSNNATEWDALATVLAPYIKKLPVDPINSVGCEAWQNNCYLYGYVTASWYGTYDLIAQFEDHSNKQRNEIVHYYPYYYWGPGSDWSAGSPYMFTDNH